MFWFSEKTDFQTCDTQAETPVTCATSQAVRHVLAKTTVGDKCSVAPCAMRPRLARPVHTFVSLRVTHLTSAIDATVSRGRGARPSNAFEHKARPVWYFRVLPVS